MRLAFLLMLTVIMLSGCASHIMTETQLSGVDLKTGFASFRDDANPHVGKVVLIGGKLRNIAGDGDIFFMEIDQLELMSNGIADEFSEFGGTFFAMTTNIKDMRYLTPGRLVSIIGEIKGMKQLKNESRDRMVPLVSIRELRHFDEYEPIGDDYRNPYANDVRDSILLRPPGPSGGEMRRP